MVINTDDVDETKWAEIQRRMAEFDRRMKKQARYSPEEIFRRANGEIEARNVVSRRNMTAEERRRTPPWETQKYADEETFSAADLKSNKQDAEEIAALLVALFDEGAQART